MKKKRPAPVQTIDADKRLSRRRIVRIIVDADGFQNVTLDCGHSSIQIIPVFCTKLSCAQCIGELIEEHKIHATQGKTAAVATAPPFDAARKV
jgi:hypothetical protein